MANQGAGWGCGSTTLRARGRWHPGMMWGATAFVHSPCRCSDGSSLAPGPFLALCHARFDAPSALSSDGVALSTGNAAERWAGPTLGSRCPDLNHGQPVADHSESRAAARGEHGDVPRVFVWVHGGIRASRGAQRAPQEVRRCLEHQQQRGPPSGRALGGGFGRG